MMYLAKSTQEHLSGAAADADEVNKTNDNTENNKVNIHKRKISSLNPYSLVRPSYPHTYPPQDFREFKFKYIALTLVSQW